MIRRYFATLAMASLLGVAAPSLAQDTPAAPPAVSDGSPISIAICNPARIFQDMQETQDLRQTMEAEGKQFEEKKREFQTKLQELQASREQLKPDSPQYAQRNQELLKVATEFEVWGKITQADVQRSQKLRMKALFEKIQDAVSKVAEQKQIDLVISEQKPEVPENIDQVNVDQLRAILNGRNVLYHTPRVDISNDVIAVLDSDYRAGK